MELIVDANADIVVVSAPILGIDGEAVEDAAAVATHEENSIIVVDDGLVSIVLCECEAASPTTTDAPDFLRRHLRQPSSRCDSIAIITITTVICLSS